MTSTPPYKYTDRDLFEEPESYEYSEVHGKPFLDAYLENRKQSIDALDRQLTAVERNDGRWDGLLEVLHWADGDAVRASLPGALGSSYEFQSIPLEALPDPVETSRVETVPLLIRLLGYPNEQPLLNERSEVWTNKLIERFEVSKRLYAMYDAEMRPVNSETASLIVYPMLALAALLVHERTGSLKQLNGSLKLCDALSSIDPESMGTGTAALARLALEEEHGAVEQLATSKGVSL